MIHEPEPHCELPSGLTAETEDSTFTSMAAVAILGAGLESTVPQELLTNAELTREILRIESLS